MRVGARVRLLECRDKQFSDDFPSLWGAPVADRGGVIFKCDQEWIFIALDHELNDVPENLEKEYARKLGVKERQIIVLERSRFESFFIADFSFAKDARGSEIVRCGQCRSLKLRHSCLLTCKRGHICCREHICVWDPCDIRHRELICNVFEHLSSHSQGLLFIEARAILAFHQLCESPEQRDKILEAFAISQYWACPVCVKEDCLEDTSLFTFGQVNEELTNSDRLRKEAFPQENGVLIDLRECLRQSSLENERLRMETGRVTRTEEKLGGEVTENTKFADHQQRYRIEINVKIQNFKLRCRVSTGASDDLLQSVIDSVGVDEWNNFHYDDFENAVFERISGGRQLQSPSDVSSGMHSGSLSSVLIPLSSPTGKKIARRRNEIRATCDVAIRIPQFKMRAICTLYEGTGYEAMFQELTAAAEISRRDFDQVVLFMVDKDGWSSKIIREEVTTEVLESCIGDIQAGAVIELRKHRTASLSGKFVMMSIAASERFNQSLQVQVRKLLETYSGYKKIGDDGNCYYRSIIYGLIEQLLINGKRQGFRVLTEIFTKLFCPSGELGDAKVAVISKFEEAFRGNIWKTPEEFEEDVLDEVGGLDINLVLLCKRLVSAFLSENKAKEYNGLSLNDAILSSFDVKNMTQFCKDYVMTMGVCAEGAHVNWGVLPALLRCQSHIVILSSDGKTDFETMHTTPEFFGYSTECLADIHLLFRVGHYDLLYTHQQMPAFVSGVEFVENSRSPSSFSPSSSTLGTAISGKSSSVADPVVQLNSLTRDRDAALERSRVLEVQFNDCVNERDVCRRECTSLRNERDASRSELEIAQTQRATAQNERDASRAQLVTVQRDFIVVQNERDAFHSELASLRQQIESMTNRHATALSALVDEHNGAMATRDAENLQLRNDLARLVIPSPVSIICPFQRYRPHALAPDILPPSASPGNHSVAETSPLFTFCKALNKTGGRQFFAVAGHRLVHVQAIVQNEDMSTGYTSSQSRMKRLRLEGGAHFNFSTASLNLDQLNVLSTLRDRFHEAIPGETAANSINTVYCYHGPRRENLASVCSTGLVAVRRTDAGYFGAGCYATLNIEYALRYARGEFDDDGGPRPTPDGRYPVVMFAATVGMAYPVTRAVDYGNEPGIRAGFSDFFGRPLKPGFDCHVVCVSEQNGFQAVNKDQADYVELVFGQESQLLPVAVLWFEEN